MESPEIGSGSSESSLDLISNADTTILSDDFVGSFHILSRSSAGSSTDSLEWLMDDTGNLSISIKEDGVFKIFKAMLNKILLVVVREVWVG